MSFLGNIFPFIGDSIGEITSHPLQAAGAALGVPGYDPFFGGLFNNRPGGALLSPTGNFTSSAWQDMYNRNPGDAGALNQFSSINSLADKIAPMIAGGYAAPGLGAAFGGAGGAASGAGAGVGADAAGAGAAGIGGAGMGTGAATGGQSLYGLFGMGAMNGAGAGSGVGAAAGASGGAGGLTGFLGGPGALGDAGMTSALSGAGSGLGGTMAGNLGGALGSAPTGIFSGLLPGGGMSGTASGALGGGLSGSVAGAAPLGSSSMGGFFAPNSFLNDSNGSMNPQTMQQASNLLSQRNQQQQQQAMAQVPNFRQSSFGNPHQSLGQIGPSMPYASFNGAQSGMPMMNNPFGFGSAYGTL